MARVDIQGEDAFLRAMKGNQDFDPDNLIDHVIDNPKAIDRLKAEFIDRPEQLAKIEEGLVSRLLPPEITSNLEDLIQTGKFGRDLAKNLEDANNFKKKISRISYISNEHYF